MNRKELANMAIGPSGGMLKRMFDPSVMKKKIKSSLGVAKSGGPKIQKPMLSIGRIAGTRPQIPRIKALSARGY